MQTTHNSTEMQHVNYESDFRVVFSFPEDKVPDYPWEIELSTPNTPAYNAFVASFDGENYHNCSMQSDTELLIAVDNHKLQPGILTYKFKIKAPDAAFPDGVMNVTTPGQLGIELWTGPSDEFEHEGVNVIVLPLEGDKGEPGEPGAPGEPGKSAYELFKEFNPDSELTEEQYAEAPIVEADRAAALADNPPKIVEVEGVQYWAFWNEETKQYVVSEYPARGDKGDKGDTGDPGEGVAPGGLTGQVLAKKSDKDFDTEWIDPGSGTSVNIVQATGQSTMDVMSQKAVTYELGKKVNAEEGKGLSTNDYTDEDKTKVANAVLTTAQTLTTEQKTQALNNIGAAAASVIGDINGVLDTINGEVI